MPGLVPGIHVLLSCFEDMDGRDKPGHDGSTFSSTHRLPLWRVRHFSRGKNACPEKIFADYQP
jgi:hypothetical protein